MADGCELECAKKYKPKVHEFVGPVKIVIVDEDPREYCRNEWGAALVALAFLLMGWTTLSVVFYTLGFLQRHPINAHLFLGTVGMLIPVGILNLNQLSGPTMVLKMSDRKFEHMITQLFGLLIGACSGAFITFMAGYEYEDLITFHGISGAIAAVFGVMSICFGALIYNLKKKRNKCIYLTHIFLGIICFTSSSICLISGILKPSMEMFFEPVTAMVYFIVLFCIFYTGVVVYSPFMKFLKAQDLI